MSRTALRPLNFLCLSLLTMACVLSGPRSGGAAETLVRRGGDLQAALNAARPGDTILLEPGATFVGNFRLPVHGGTTMVTVRSAAPAASLPTAGTRIGPEAQANLPKLRSPNSQPALSTAPGAAYWRLSLLEFQANDRGFYDIIALGDGGGAQSTPASVPHHLILDRLLIRGDRLIGQKRGIALNSGETEIRDSYISDIKAIGQDSQAIAGWNGPGPYLIENNYLEAAADVVMFGGSDPKISGLVPADIQVRRNTITRPVEWRDPIVATPGGLRATKASDGSLPADRLTYHVVAQRPSSDGPISSKAAQATIDADAGSAVTLSWSPVADATGYRVYRRGRNGQWTSWSVAAPSFTDKGTGGTPEAPPAAAVWQVKNLLELKNARRVRIERNLFANHWEQAQSGGAILFTPRNQDGGCRWCVVEDVTFESNVIRSVGAVFTILGRDDEKPSQQLNSIRIRNNVIVDLSLKWGGAGYFMLLMGDPRDIVVDHNTIISPDGIGIIAVDGPPIRGFVFTNNLARHNKYGILGTGKGVGIDAIKTFLPESVITRNVFADNVERYTYPPGNDYPSASEFEAQFTDYARGDFSLKPSSKWRRAGSDGQDLGAPPLTDENVRR
jgi:hypothetical protein